MHGGTRSYEMARRLVAMGHAVTIITSWREADDRTNWFTTDESGIRVHWLPLPYSNHMSYWQRIAAFFKFAWGAARHAASLPADIVFATSTPLTIALPGAYAAHRQKVPMVFEVRDLWPAVPIALGVLRNPVVRAAALWLERFAYRSSSEVVALSPGMVAGVIKTGYPAEQISEIPNSADLDFFKPNKQLRTDFRLRHSVPDWKILMVYTGTFGMVNEVGYFAYLAKALEDDERFHFLSIGGGIDFKNVYETASKLGVLDKNLTMLASVPKAQMSEVLAAADIASSFVAPIPELEANSANKFFDGLSAGCCFVVNHGGWQAALLTETSAGFQLDRDVKVAAQQLKVLADEPARLANAKVAARKLAEERFSREMLAEKLEQVLLRAVAAHKPD